MNIMEIIWSVLGLLLCFIMLKFAWDIQKSIKEFAKLNK